MGHRDKAIAAELKRRVELRALLVQAISAGDDQPLTDALEGRLGHFHPDIKAYPTQSSLLACAIQANALGPMIRLLDAGANIEAQDQQGARALHFAAHSGAEEILVELIARGAQLNPKTRWDERTPLMCAAKANRPLCALALLKAGAEAEMIDRAGRTARELARALYHPEIAELLEKREASGLWIRIGARVDALLEKGALARAVGAGGRRLGAPRI